MREPVGRCDALAGGNLPGAIGEMLGAEQLATNGTGEEIFSTVAAAVEDPRVQPGGNQ
ncbi:MAG: hypothetical protein ABJD11_06985 [Gemmatimonadota bacterium]